MKRYLQWIVYYGFIALPLLARAGGAGGSSSSRNYSSTSSRGDISPIVGIGVILFIIIYNMVKSDKASEEEKGREEENQKKSEKFKERNPNLKEDMLYKKIEKVFLQVQYAWADKELKRVRNYMSDSIYQRFNSQIMMMDELGQKNTIKNLSIDYIGLCGIEFDGDFDIIYVEIAATIEDSFVCSIDRNFDRCGKEWFSEYWAFIKKSKDVGIEVEVNEECPNCGAGLEGIEDIEVARCPYCQSIINSGEFDWVLSEIYQNYSDLKANIESYKKLEEKKQGLLWEDSNFSKQFIEDKACNALVQYDKARALCRPELARRFLADKIYKKLEDDLVGAKPYYYITYYFEYSNIIDLYQEGSYNYIVVEVQVRYKRVAKINSKFSGDAKLKLLDKGGIGTRKVEVVLKKENNNIYKNLYAHNCPSCGGILEDTIDTHCPYCKELIVDSRYDGVVVEINE